MKYKIHIIALFVVIFLSLFFGGFYNASSKEGYENNPEIPLNIYQTWETKDLPEKMRENVERLKSQNPEFKHYLFDDADRREFIRTHFEEDVLQAYNKIIPGAYRADLWRYCVLYINGGVYLDIKYSNVGEFKLIQLADNEYFVPDIDDSGGGIYNAFMICKPGNNIMREAIRRIVENVKTEYYGDSGLSPTGPLLLKSCFSASEFEKTKKNGLTICRYNENTSVCLNDNPILTVYDEYYKNERAMSSQPPYYELWKDRKIYNK
jgi:mannosyltransferase OCH1-like enzyme